MLNQDEGASVGRSSQCSWFPF